LILKDGLEWQLCGEVMQQLTHTLQQLGYPLCPGNVMVNNPKWVRSQTQWKKTLADWVKAAKPEQVMDIAIMADAHAVAGNKS
ncbi:cyclic nucleotide-binding protein, partial [Vibrio parahaemolyticus]|nr:cyclic nucleotide-binding protein [Vibrio parahaemolyticus]